MKIKTKKQKTGIADLVKNSKQSGIIFRLDKANTNDLIERFGEMYGPNTIIRKMIESQRQIDTMVEAPINEEGRITKTLAGKTIKYLVIE